MKSVVKTIKAKLAHQMNTSPFIGSLINVYSSTAIVFTPLTFLGVATTLYGLWGADAIQAWLPWFTFGHLIGVLVIFVLVLMVFFYKVIIPSMYAFQMQQQYKHRNPLVTDMQAVLEGQEKLSRRLGKIETTMGIPVEEPEVENKG